MRAQTLAQRTKQAFVFWTHYTEEKHHQWLSSEMSRGRLRQGWGLNGMSLLDSSGDEIEESLWIGRYIAAGTQGGWLEKDLSHGEAKKRRHILLQMLAIQPGDLLVIPRKPSLEEVGFALAKMPYRFDVAVGQHDFGHLIEVEEVVALARSSVLITQLVAGFSHYRSAITPIRKQHIAGEAWNAFTQLTAERRSDELVSLDVDKTLPQRITTDIQRIVRDTAKGRDLKGRYGHRCQICGIGIPLRSGTNVYVEVHHLIPLGRPFDGNDDWNNMIVVCPNCHTAFDYGSYRINPSTLRVHTQGGEKAIKFVEGHQLDPDNVQRHWQLTSDIAKT